MIKLTWSLQHFLFENYRNVAVLVMFGHTELLTEEIYNEYLEWCKTEEGKSYLEGGENYKEVE